VGWWHRAGPSDARRGSGSNRRRDGRLSVPTLAVGTFACGTSTHRIHRRPALHGSALRRHRRTALRRHRTLAGRRPGTLAGRRSRSLTGRRHRRTTLRRHRTLTGRGSRTLARRRHRTLTGRRHRRTTLRRHRTLAGRRYRATPGGIGVSTAAGRPGHVGTPSGVATARFVATRVVVVGGTHVRISSNFGGRVEFSVDEIGRAIVSLTRCSTVRLTGTRPRTTGLLGRGDGPEDIGLDEVVPTARPTHLDHMDRELLLGRREADEFVRCSRRPGQGPELLAEHPGHQRELLLAADGAHHVAATSMELGSAKQVRICITDRCDTRPTGVDLGQQRPTLKGVVHHLSLKSHEDQSTCGPSDADLRTPPRQRAGPVSASGHCAPPVPAFAACRVRSAVPRSVRSLHSLACSPHRESTCGPDGTVT
jgi:hypothetical protein